jgi:hypothetical protein
LRRSGSAIYKLTLGSTGRPFLGKGRPRFEPIGGALNAHQNATHRRGGVDCRAVRVDELSDHCGRYDNVVRAFDPVQDRDLGEAVANGDRRVLGHYETRIAFRSMLSFISG